MSANTAPSAAAGRELADLRGFLSASAASLREAAVYLVDRYAGAAEEEAEIRAVLEPVADALDGAARIHGGGQ